MRFAITGPSGCGKSTLTKMLASKHGYTHLCLDDYWEGSNYKFRMETPTETLRIFEFAQEYDGNRLAQDALKSPNVFMEGFCLMAFPEIRKIVDHQFYIDVPWKISVKRRLARDGNSKSTRGWLALGEHGNDLLTSFQKDLVDTTVINGDQTPEQLYTLVRNFIFNDDGK